MGRAGKGGRPFALLAPNLMYLGRPGCLCECVCVCSPSMEIKVKRRISLTRIPAGRGYQRAASPPFGGGPLDQTGERPERFSESYLRLGFGPAGARRRKCSQDGA
jgi:hypothetical protein